MKNNKITKKGHRYIDTESNQAIEAFYCENDEHLVRSCLAEKYNFIKGELFEITIDITESPKSTEDSYLRLYLLSSLAVKPNEINLEGIFSNLINVAWTSSGPVLPQHVPSLRTKVASDFHHLTVHSVDKFPRLTDYIIPKEVRIGDADRVRLGAHLSAGTTVMHEGFVNFNAGTLGKGMIEGRVTPGVTVGEGSDIGAGASIMGTLSGGGKKINSIGENSLLGANAGTGISLGDQCIVEAGLYVTSGTKVKCPDGVVRHARDLSGQSNLLFRRNSVSGQVEAIPTNSSKWGGINTELHSN